MGDAQRAMMEEECVKLSTFTRANSVTNCHVRTCKGCGTVTSGSRRRGHSWGELCTRCHESTGYDAREEDAVGPEEDGALGLQFMYRFSANDLDNHDTLLLHSLPRDILLRVLCCLDPVEVLSLEAVCLLFRQGHFGLGSGSILEDYAREVHGYRKWFVAPVTRIDCGWRQHLADLSRIRRHAGKTFMGEKVLECRLVGRCTLQLIDIEVASKKCRYVHASMLEVQSILSVDMVDQHQLRPPRRRRRPKRRLANLFGLLDRQEPEEPDEAEDVPSKTFSISTTDGTYMIEAATHSEAMAWVESLQSAKKYVDEKAFRERHIRRQRWVEGVQGFLDGQQRKSVEEEVLQSVEDEGKEEEETRIPLGIINLLREVNDELAAAQKERYELEAEVQELRDAECTMIQELLDREQVELQGLEMQALQRSIALQRCVGAVLQVRHQRYCAAFCRWAASVPPRTVTSERGGAGRRAQENSTIRLSDTHPRACDAPRMFREPKSLLVADGFPAAGHEESPDPPAHQFTHRFLNPVAGDEDFYDGLDVVPVVTV